jgi:uncharacterized protein YhaN
LKRFFGMIANVLSSGVTMAIFLAFILAFNAAFMFSAAFASAVSGFLSSAGVSTAFETVSQKLETTEQRNKKLQADNNKMKARVKANKSVVKRVNKRVFSRTLKSAGRNIASMPFESVPIWGIAAIVGTTVWEISDGCLNLDDLHELYVQFGVEPEYPAYQQQCMAYAEQVDGMKESLQSQYQSAEKTAKEWSKAADEAIDTTQEESRLIFEDLKASTSRLFGWD